MPQRSRRLVPTVIALLCADRPESGLPFWLGADRRLSRFLHWALDLREPGQQRALLDMLGALAKRMKYQLESTKVSSVSVSRRAGFPQLGQSTFRKASHLFSGLPEPSGIRSSGSTTGRSS